MMIDDDDDDDDDDWHCKFSILVVSQVLGSFPRALMTAIKIPASFKKLKARRWASLQVQGKLHSFPQISGRKCTNARV